MAKRWSLGLLGLVACQVAPSPRSPPPLDANRLVSAAVFAQGRVWLLTESDKLASLAEDESTPTWQPLPGPALGLCSQGGQLLVASCSGPDCDEWLLQKRDARGFSRLAVVSGRGERFAGFGCTETQALLLSNRRLVEVSGAGPREVALSEELLGGRVTSVLSTSNGVLVGLSAGEWGGGLRRIDPRSGKLSVVHRNASNQLCGGPLNRQCDPVQSLAPLPWKPACVAAAIGLLHLGSHGRITEVCGADVQRLYYGELEAPAFFAPRPPPNPARDEPPVTVAFFGLVRSGDALLAAGIDGLYRLESSGGRYLRPYPEPEQYGAFGLSFDVPGVVMVAHRMPARWGKSTAPLLVPRP